jgi:hypothetical protein
MQTANTDYSVTFNADNATGSHPAKGEGVVALGVIEEPILWKRMNQGIASQQIASAKSVADFRYAGGNCAVHMTFKEWTPQLQKVLWPYASDFGAVGNVGSSLLSLAGELVLTAATNSPGASSGPATLTFGRAAPHPNQDVIIPLGLAGRDVEVTFVCFPYEEAGVQRWFIVE